MCPKSALLLLPKGQGPACPSNDWPALADVVRWVQDRSFLASGVCPLVGEVAPGAYTGFLVGGTDACPLVDGAGSCPSNGRGCVKWCVLT